MGVPVRYLELDNEKADNPLAPYLAAAGKVVARARAVYPDAQISVIGCFGLADLQGCHAALKVPCMPLAIRLMGLVPPTSTR